MSYGVLFETDNFITGAMNRAGISAVTFDGGCPVVAGGVNATDKELYNLTAFATGVTTVGIAFNPSRKYDIIGGQKFPAQSSDDRNYTNNAGSIVDYFIPTKGLEFGVIANNIDEDATPAKGKFLEPVNGETKWGVVATQTVGVPSFEIIDTKKAIYLNGGFADTDETVYIVKTRYNG